MPIAVLPQGEIAAMKVCRCGGTLRDITVRSRDGGIDARQCTRCKAVYVLRLFAVAEVPAT